MSIAVGGGRDCRREEREGGRHSMERVEVAGEAREGGR